MRLLVDTANLYMRHRAKLSHLKTSDGRPSGALFGTVRAVDSLVRRFDADDVVMCAESAGGNVRRRKVVSSYKADRLDREIFQPGHEEGLYYWTMSSGYGWFMLDGCEADDLIAFLAALSTREGEECVIASSDHDFIRCLSPKVWLLRAGVNAELYTEYDLEQDLSIRPSEYLMVCALAGDSSDNVKGIPGIGETSAVKLIEKHGCDLERIVRDPAVAPFENRVRRNFRCMEFIDMPHDHCGLYIQQRSRDVRQLKDFYLEWEMRSLADKLAIEETGENGEDAP